MLHQFPDVFCKSTQSYTVPGADLQHHKTKTIIKSKHTTYSYPKIGFASVVPQKNQVGVRGLSPIGHAQQNAMVELFDFQLQIDLLGGIADVPGQLQLTQGVQEDVVGQGGSGVNRRSLVGRHQEHNHSSQNGEVHESDVLQAQVFVQKTHCLCRLLLEGPFDVHLKKFSRRKL